MGWANAVCIPIPQSLGRAQLSIVSRVCNQVERFTANIGHMSTAPEAIKNLKSKSFDYAGQPVEHMLELDAVKVIAAWPEVGHAGVVDLKDCLPPDLAESLDHPENF